MSNKDELTEEFESLNKAVTLLKQQKHNCESLVTWHADLSYDMREFFKLHAQIIDVNINLCQKRADVIEHALDVISQIEQEEGNT